MNKDADLLDLFIEKEADLTLALKKIDAGGEKILFVIEDNKLWGTLTDGDIRRWILKTGSLQGKAGDLCNRFPTTLKKGYHLDEAKALMLKKKLEQIPILDDEGRVVDVLFWEEVFLDAKTKAKIEMPVVIMAGGRGERLDPLTRILPKALIPIGQKPVIEVIMDRFIAYGIDTFYLTVHHKNQMIKAYFKDAEKNVNILYIEEAEPLGTAGSLRTLIHQSADSFFVTNCDIIVEEDYTKIVNCHFENKNEITLVVSLRQYRIPYGICEIENGGLLKQIIEKPKYDFLVNTGMYILNRRALMHIPENKFLLMTDFIGAIKQQGGRVGVFPISEKSWTDVGQWEEYKDAISKIPWK